MGKNKQNGGRQQGALSHAPSQQGEKTRARQAEIAHSSSPKKRQKGPIHDPSQIRAHADAGKDRLFENRQQHDEAEKNSEKTRLARDVDRHNHDPEKHPRRSRGSSTKR